eukprot:5300399-Pyramimonas_sp.AAC.1
MTLTVGIGTLSVMVPSPSVVARGRSVDSIPVAGRLRLGGGQLGIIASAVVVVAPVPRGVGPGPVVSASAGVASTATAASSRPVESASGVAGFPKPPSGSARAIPT